MSKTIGYRLGRAETPHRHTFNHRRADALPEQTVCELHSADARTNTLRCPVLGPYRHPDCRSMTCGSNFEPDVPAVLHLTGLFGQRAGGLGDAGVGTAIT